MVTAVVESPLRQRQRQRLQSSSTLATSGSTVGGDDFEEVRHLLRPAKQRSSVSGGGGGMRGRRWAPPEIEIPNGLDSVNGGGGGGGGRGSYTSLRDIMSSPEYAAAKASSPNEEPGVGTNTAVADVHMIRHPLVKHAAYAYLQLTPSARDAEARRRMLLQRRRPLCRIFLGCLGFLGALFGR